LAQTCPARSTGTLALSLVVWPPKGSRLEDQAVPLGRQVYRQDVRKKELACMVLKIVSSTVG
jgi:hypothetical protein